MLKKSWTLLGQQHVSDHRILKVRHDQYRFEPTGVVRDYVVIEAPDWCNVVPVTEDGQVVLVRQFRHGIGDVALEIPGGIIDPGESPEAAASRELLEETGYASDQIRFLGRVHPNPAIQGNYQYMFLAENCRLVSPPCPDPFEQFEILLRPLSEIPEMIRREEIQHTLVINAFAFMGILQGLS